MITGVACALCLFFGYAFGWCNRVRIEKIYNNRSNRGPWWNGQGGP